MRRLASWLLDTGPVLVLAAIAGAGSFTHIRDTATTHGQTGWMSWAVAVCVDLTCVMAARERQRDKKTGRQHNGWVSWPTLVLAGGIVLSLAANLHKAEPTMWGWLTAATPAGAFLIAVSMLERRAAAPRPAQSTPVLTVDAVPSSPSPAPALVPAVQDGQDGEPGPSPALVDYARRVADEHQAKHGKPITRDLLRARLGVSNQLASDLLHTLRTASESA
ncbi:DUF2637 domain-containing protein [Microbispora sp. SCL1-1]|uniref:DUF2637 domain-containing protein n=1 Tax=unclassified Microbispora TaxID=2614687 RepID=UPI0011594A2C|nr:MULTISPECIES: DUF2637 domain-containing protein [unclassified Microbispora]NJP26786.1 DUF2637 domain-containing protein [Microbispora sp. CL1-1]TQS11980.1 DUF2637 domain-containing protein [Microbispora sp. SCL1-1]